MKVSLVLLPLIGFAGGVYAMSQIQQFNAATPNTWAATPAPVEAIAPIAPVEVAPAAPVEPSKREMKLARIAEMGIDCSDFYSDHNLLILEPGTDLANPSTTVPALDGYLSMAQEIDYCVIPAE